MQLSDAEGVEAVAFIAALTNVATDTVLTTMAPITVIDVTILRGAEPITCSK